jgi:hypothetical protein
MSKWLKNIDVLLNLILLKNVKMTEKYWRIIESDTSEKCQNGWKIMMYYWIWYFWKMSKWMRNIDVFIESDNSQKCQNGWKIMMYLSNLIHLKNIKMVEKYWCILLKNVKMVEKYWRIYWIW